MKSTYDLVQSIFYSLKKESPYNWIICEGISEKIYFEEFFKEEIKDLNLRVLPMAGKPNVIRMYKYLETPMREEKCDGKVFCLIDTDLERCDSIASIQNLPLQIRRLSNKNNNEKTALIELSNNDTYPTDIEQALNPEIFQQTISELSSSSDYQVGSIQNKDGNSDFIKNFKNLDLENFFKENNGDNKVAFAKNYIEFSQSSTEDENKIPDWIYEVKAFFRN